MADKHLDSDLALLAGSVNDSLYLGLPSVDVSNVTGLTSAIPTGMVDCGWINDEGIGLEFSDSVEKIRGHQGNAVVKTFMSQSDTTLSATLLESKLLLVQNFFDAAAEKLTAETGVTKLHMSGARGVKRLVGILDVYDTSGDPSTQTGKAVQMRFVFPHLELGQRDSLAFKTGSIVAYKYSLSILDGWDLYSNAPSLQPAATTPVVAGGGGTPSAA